MCGEVDKNVMNTLQYVIDNSKSPFSVYLEGDNPIVPTKKRWLNPDGTIKAKDGIMLLDEEENQTRITYGFQDVYYYLADCLLYTDDGDGNLVNATKEQLIQIHDYFKSKGVEVDEECDRFIRN